jgi:YD repeat-containing protein
MYFSFGKKHYDRLGNRTEKNNAINSNFDELYSCDAIRLGKPGVVSTRKYNRNSGYRTQSWDYDALGNWTSVTTNGSTQTRSANMQNEYTSVSGASTPTYDANGNMLSDETGKQYVYDAWNRLKVVKNSSGTTLVTYHYDARNYRIAEAVGSDTRSLYYSTQWQVLEERVNGSARVSNVWSVRLCERRSESL